MSARALSAASADPTRFCLSRLQPAWARHPQYPRQSGCSGAAFQLTKEGIADNTYAACWLAERGFSRPVLIGHSNGGMLAVKHVADHAETPAMVLLSAHGGGRDGVQRTSRAGLLAC
jgi:pimeloyl-ACP methyl ester carboxylesterase